MWFLYALLSAITAALVAIFGKLGLSKIDTTLATTLRAMIMASFFILASLILRKFEGFRLSSLDGKQWTYIILAGLAGAFSWFFYFLALKYGIASKVAAIDRLSVVFVFILSLVVLSEKFTWTAAGGAVLIVGGAIMMTIAK